MITGDLNGVALRLSYGITALDDGIICVASHYIVILFGK
jgi:hypothetical protein